MRIYIFYFFLILFQISFISNIIVLPIAVKKKSKQDIDDPDEYYLTTNLNIGEPIQELECEINFEISDYYLDNYPSYVIPKYNISSSNSIEKTPIRNIASSKFTGGNLIYETFYFYNDINCENKKKYEHIKIALPGIDNKLYGCEIGFQTRHSNQNSISFINELQSYKIVNNYIWTLKLNNLDEGSLIIGAEPHEYDQNYKQSELKFINSFSEKSKPNWCLYFKYDPTYNNYTINLNIKVLISPKIYGVVANYHYLQAIEENFFKKYYEKNICQRTIISFQRRNYFKVVCSKDYFTQKDIDSFFPLNLYSIAFNYTFILEGKELFLETEDKYELGILSEIGYSSTEWKLGRVFLKKYQIIFDDDNGLIGFYRSDNNIEEEKKSGMSTALKIVILFFVSCVFLFLSFLIYKKINSLSKRKKFANELEDDFMYISKNNVEKK